MQRDHRGRGHREGGASPRGSQDRHREHSGLGKDLRGIAEVKAQVPCLENGALGCSGVYCEKQQVSAEEGI